MKRPPSRRPRDGSADHATRSVVPPARTSAIVLAACVAAAACSTTAGSRTNEGPKHEASIADSVPRTHAAVDLTGAWVRGSSDEPAAESIVTRPPCNYSPATWVIEQRGDIVFARSIPASAATGVYSTRPAPSVPIKGRVVGVDLTMGTDDERYVLRYDSTSRHLRGTLNGAPFWAVREVIVQPRGCIPVP